MGIPGFDLIVYKDGECVLRYMGGYADPDKKIPISGKEKYHIYSCSKLLTCVAAMQLWEKGMFSLEDKLGDYIPAYREMTVKTENGIQKAKNPILIKHLFEMTSGMNYELTTPELLEYYKTSGGKCPTVELVEQFAKTPLEFEPGTSWRYSLSHDVLAALVEILSGQKVQDYIKEHIFDPLGMENSDFLHPMDDWEGFARQYVYKEATKEFVPLWKNPYRPGPEYVSGGAGCVSTVEDFIKFLEALRIGDIILKKETIKLMATDRLTPQQEAAYTYGGTGIGYGLGMRAPKADQRTTDFGWGGAAGAVCRVDPVHNWSVYYGQHVLTSPNRAARSWLTKAIQADLDGVTIQIPEIEENLPENITY